MDQHEFAYFPLWANLPNGGKCACCGQKKTCRYTLPPITMGNTRVKRAINDLILQIKSIEKVVAALGLKTVAFEGSDSLDNLKSVFR